MYFEKAVKADNDSIKALHNLATIHLLAGKREQAVQEFHKVLTIDPNSDKTLNNFAIALMEEQQLDKALGYLRKATTIDPSNSAAWYNSGVALLMKNLSPLAIDAFKRYLKLRPEDDKTWFLCADLGLRSADSEKEEAKGFLLNAIEANPKEGEYLEAFVGRVPLKTTEEELRLHYRLLKLLPDVELKLGHNWGDLSNRLLARTAFLLIRLGHYAEARKTLGNIQLRKDQLDNCRSRLAYKLVSGQIGSRSLSEPSLEKNYYETIHAHFFGIYYRVHSIPSPDPKRLVDSYRQLLQGRPFNLGCLIGKGILQAEILEGDERAWSNYGFITKGDDPAAWKRVFTAEAILSLRKASGQTTDSVLKSDLSECIKELEDLEDL